MSPFSLLEKVFLLQKVEVVELRETMRTLNAKNEILLNRVGQYAMEISVY